MEIIRDVWRVYERLALAAETLAGRQVWRRPQLNDIAMFHVHKDGMDSLSVTDSMKVLCNFVYLLRIAVRLCLVG